MTRRQVIVGIAALLAVVAFATSWSHCVDVLIYGGQPRYLSWVIASLPEVTCLLVALRLMDGERGPLTWTVGAIGFGFTVVANASTAGGEVDPNTHWLWSELGALWPAVSTVLAFLLMGHSEVAPAGESARGDSPRPAREGSPQLAPPDPMDSIGATLEAIEGLRAVAAETRPAPPRATARVLAPPRPNTPRPAPAPSRGDTGGRPAPAWTTRSALGPGPHPGRTRGDLLADVRAAVSPTDGVPSAVALATHYRIKNESARALRDALRTDRSQPGAGGADREIN